MSKTFTDENLLVWEAYASGERHGYSSNTAIVFNCLTNRMLRPRIVGPLKDEAKAEALIAHASPNELRDLFKKARELD